jgi:hypothetical protein
MLLHTLPHVLSPQLLIKILSVGDKGKKYKENYIQKTKKVNSIKAEAISTVLAI